MNHEKRAKLTQNGARISWVIFLCLALLMFARWLQSTSVHDSHIFPKSNINPKSNLSSQLKVQFPYFTTWIKPKELFKLSVVNTNLYLDSRLCWFVLQPDPPYRSCVPIPSDAAHWRVSWHLLLQHHGSWTFVVIHQISVPPIALRIGTRDVPINCFCPRSRSESFIIEYVPVPSHNPILVFS